MKTKLKSEKTIAFLTIDFPPVIGGISRYLYELIRNLPVTRINIIGLNAPDSAEFDSNQTFHLNRINLPFGWKYFHQQFRFLAFLYFFELLKFRNIRTIVCGQAHYSVMLPAWLYSKIFRCSFGVVAHGLDLLHPQTQIFSIVFNYLLRASRLVIVNSRATADITIKLGVDAKKVHIIHPGVSRFETSKSVSTQIDKKILFNLQHKKCILTVGRLIERKGHDTVIKAMPKILLKVPDAHYIIVGTGAQQEKLKQLSTQLCLESHVTFVGHALDEDLPTYYEACKVFSMISREIPERGDIEGFGIVYLEANLYGKPVVAGKSGGVEDAVLHNINGLLIEPDNPDAAAEAITRLLIDSSYARELGLRGQQRVTKEFNSLDSARKFQTILDGGSSGTA